MTPYYSDEFVTLYLGDCREVTEWLAADVLVFDPPYGVSWSQHGGGKRGNRRGTERRAGIANDSDTGVRDAILELWGDRPAITFGSFAAPRPCHVTHTAVYRMASNAGVLGSTTGFRRDVTPIYLTGRWPKRAARWSSVIETATTAGSPNSPQKHYRHPHAKPLDVMATLLSACPDGMVADPTAGSGSTLVAAKALGRKSIGVELDEAYCERAANRLSIPDLFGGAA